MIKSLNLTKFTATLFILLIPLTSYAAGLSISPASLDFEMAGGELVSRTIVVSNPTADVLVFEVYADEFEEVIVAKPESFTLEAGGRKEVVISVDAQKLSSSQSLSTNLSVVGKALAESKINVGAGAKLPLTVTLVNERKTTNSNILIAVAAAIVISAFYFGRRYGKKIESSGAL